jgi:hypothetical protein
MTRFLGILICGILTALVAGCGGNPAVTQQGMVITATFAGTLQPQAVATKTGDGAFVPASLQGNVLSLILPTGTTKYGIAYVCSLLNDEFVLEATTQDATALNVSCPGSSTSALGLATGSVDASTIPGVTDVRIIGGGFGGSVGVVSGPFSVGLPNGSDDVAFIATDSIGNAVGVKIARGQSIPGAVNGGSTVLFGPGDATTTQPVTVNNVPAGFLAPKGAFAQYHTANGTAFPLLLGLGIIGQVPNTYPALPAAATQSGDFYLYQTTTLNSPPSTQLLGTTLTTTNGGGPVTLTLPAPWSFAGPAAAVFPTFTFNYSGFSGQPAISQQALLIWPTGPTPASRNLLSVIATANFQNGATTLTIPDLTALSGFFAPATSGTQVSWLADIFGGTAQEFIFSVNPPANGSISFVENRGSYIQP